MSLWGATVRPYTALVGAEFDALEGSVDNMSNVSIFFSSEVGVYLLALELWHHS